MKNITNKTKTILLSFLIVAIILPFSAMNFAEAQQGEKYTANDIKNAITKADQYITIKEHIVTFDKKSAKDTMSKHEIKIIYDFVKMQNDYVDKVKKNPNKKHQMDSEINDKFAELKKQVKESKVKNIDFAQWILPKAFAWTDVCGGSFDNPHDEYAKKTTGTYSTENVAAVAALNMGYHQVPIYASDPLSYFETVDMGKSISAYNCNFGAFRDQIVVTENNSNYDHRKQIKEPNPEFLSFSAPVWWWTWYTAQWHTPGLGQTIITSW